MSAGLHISISAEPVFSVGNVVISNSILTSWVVTGFLILFALAFYLTNRNRSFQDKPSKLQTFVEFIIESLYNLTHSIAGSHHKARIFFPLIASFFFFIMFSNWSGLLPGVGTVGYLEQHEAQADTHDTEITSNEHVVDTPDTIDEHAVESVEHPEENTQPIVEDHAESADAPIATEHEASEGTFVPYFRAPTADLNTTLALAVFSIATVQIMGVKFLNLGYFKKFLNFSSPIYFAVGILEIMSEISRIISFAFRLFGNIFAGEVLLAVIAFLIPVALPIPFLGLEIFVGFIQALVFSLLTLVFLSTATVSHGEEH